MSQNPVSTFSGSKKGRKSPYEMSAMPHNNLDQFLGVAPSAPKKQPPPPVEEEYEAVLEIGKRVKFQTKRQIKIIQP